MNVSVRPATDDDAEEVDRLGELRRERGEVWEVPDRDERSGDVGRCQVALVADRVAGVGWVEWWDEADGTHLYLLLGFVHPDLRGRGVGRALLGEQERWARQHGHARGLDAVTFGGNADDARPRAQALLIAGGYQVAFTVVEMEAAVPDEADAPTAPPGFSLGPMDADRHREVHTLVEAAFATSRFGAVPRDFDDYLHEVASAPSGLDLWHLAWRGEELAGAVVNIVADGVAETPWLAVAPQHRRHGVGEALMRASLAAFATRGVRTARLSTIAESTHGSVALYERVGYRVTARWPRYRKPSA